VLAISVASEDVGSATASTVSVAPDDIPNEIPMLDADADVTEDALTEVCC